MVILATVNYKKLIEEIEEGFKKGLFKTDAEIRTANDMLNQWREKAGISTPAATTTDPSMPQNALRNVLSGTGAQIDWDEKSKMVTVTNPAANRTIQFKTGEGQQYGLAPGHVNNYNVVEDVNLLLSQLGFPTNAGVAEMAQNKNVLPDAVPTWTAPGPYQSKYSDNIDALLLALQNRPAFSYDPEDDPSYQSYKKMYTAEGKNAFNDQIANLTALTGGRLNSYATAAASQAQNAYAQQLSNIIPTLENAAYNRYLNELKNDYNMLQTLLGLDTQEYNRYRDTVGDTKYGYETEYGAYRDRVSDFINQRNYNRGVLESDRAFNEGVRQFDKSFDEGVRQFDTTFNRGVFESDRAFDEDVRRYNQEFDRGIFESDRAFNEGVRQFDTTFNRGVFESDRDFYRNVLESDRDYGLRKDEFEYRKQQDTKKELESTPPTAGQLSNYYQILNGLTNRFDNPADALAYVNKMGKDLYVNLIGENLYNQLLADLQSGFQQVEPETLGAMYQDMMSAPDPEAWLKENAPYMTNEELKQAIKWLPKEKQLEMLKELFISIGD